MTTKITVLTSDLDHARSSGVAPWQTVVDVQPDYVVFADAYAVTQGHLLFVPRQETWLCLAACYQAAYETGTAGVREGRWEAFNIGQNIGAAAGQTVLYPHVHMIPRRQGDCEDPTGGVRGVIAAQQNYRKAEYQKP
jgi:diadenosine tetraphosphate (Ap4A) HIT family hydrolase